jgi:hypothetical protein
MFRDKLVRLLERLRIATEQRQIEWEDTADEDMFRTSLGNGMVRIGKKSFLDEEGDPQTVYTAYLLTRDGMIADETEITGGKEYAAMESLYALARQSTRGADELIDSMLNELSTLKAGT